MSKKLKTASRLRIKSIFTAVFPLKIVHFYEGQFINSEVTKVSPKIGLKWGESVDEERGSV